MRLEALRSAVLEANLELVRRGLILYTFGNASGMDRESGLVVLVAGHAPFCWNSTPAEAAHKAVVLEAVARMAYYTSTLNAACTGVTQHLLDRHYFRKHGASKTYGQES